MVHRRAARSFPNCLLGNRAGTWGGKRKNVIVTENLHSLLHKIEQLNSIGIALSAQRDTPKLLEQILVGARSITGADGGTLYTVSEDRCLHFEMILTESLRLAMGGTSGVAVPFAPIPLYDASGNGNRHMVAPSAVLDDRIINIPDAYDTTEFDFSGTHAFDRRMAYHSRSFLTIPMKNHRGEIIGVLQLINKLDARSGAILAFTREDEQLVSSLASQAAVALTNKELIDELKALFESFIQLIASAIDEKSPYTGGHCRRVPELTMMLARAAAAAASGPLRDFNMSDGDYYELEIAAWLHDCGKITTPEYIVDKATKLETIFDRINLVAARAEIARRDLEIGLLRQRLAQLGQDPSAALPELAPALAELAADLAFLRQSNTGSEFMAEPQRERVRAIAGKYRMQLADGEHGLLSDNEVTNLCIARGTLTDEERKVINHHITATLRMLEKLPFPRHLRRVPEFAGGHHERMDGKGYPRGLRGEQMSVQARIMAIADIFEALTASDRPYKKAKPLSEALAILGRMKQDSHIDPDLFAIFMQERVYLHYAKKYLDITQIDIDAPEEVPGYPF